YGIRVQEKMQSFEKLSLQIKEGVWNVGLMVTARPFVISHRDVHTYISRKILMSKQKIERLKAQDRVTTGKSVCAINCLLTPKTI
ncbi:MAG: hypothetical protein COZ70_02930, partial [Deltaproteobacteria bacterium CG_4_8_14_3_um_filter_51_11]